MIEECDQEVSTGTIELLLCLTRWSGCDLGCPPFSEEKALFDRISEFQIK